MVESGPRFRGGVKSARSNVCGLPLLLFPFVSFKSTEQLKLAIDADY